MNELEIGEAAGTGLALLTAVVTWWRVYGPRWKPVSNGSTSLAKTVAELKKCEEDREELRELVVDAVIERLDNRTEEK